MISGKCQLYAKNGEMIEKAQYFEGKQFPESMSTHQKEESKNVFPVNVTSTNTRVTFPSVKCRTQYASENQTNGANKEENNIQKTTFDEKSQLEGNNTQSTCHRFRTSFGNNNFSHNPQLIQQHKGNPCNLQFTHREAIKANAMCSMLGDLNATMIQPANTALFLSPFFNFNQFEFLISVPQIYQFIPQHPHYHCILFQPFSGILLPPQTMPCQYCQPRVEYCRNLCIPCQSQKVPIITKESKKESSSENTENYRLNTKIEKNVRKAMPRSVHLKQKDKHSENKAKVDEYQIPHASSMMNYPRIQSKQQEKSECSSSQSFKNWKRSSTSKMEHQSLEMNGVEQRINSSENSIDEIHGLKYMNPKFPHTNLRLNENHHTFLNKRIEYDDIGWENNQIGNSRRKTPDFRREDYLFHPCSTSHKKPAAKPLKKNKTWEDPRASSRSELGKGQVKNYSQKFNATTRNSQRNDLREKVPTSSRNRNHNVEGFLKNILEKYIKSSEDDTLSNDSGDKRKLDREGEKFTESNLKAKLMGERPVIYQNGIQEMNVITSHEDKNGKKDLDCKSHSYKQVDEVCCPSIWEKVNKSIKSKDTQLEPEEADQIRELIASYSPLTVGKTKAIINLVLQQLLENREKNKGEDSAPQNLQISRNACNNYMDSQRKYCMKITDDGGQIINYNDKERAFIPSTSLRNPMNEKEEANVSSNKMSTQSCSSTTFKQTHFVQSTENFSSKEFDSESGIETD